MCSRGQLLSGGGLTEVGRSVFYHKRHVPWSTRGFYFSGIFVAWGGGLYSSATSTCEYARKDGSPGETRVECSERHDLLRSMVRDVVRGSRLAAHGAQFFRKGCGVR